MLKLIVCELWKLKRKRLFQAAFLTAFIMPLFYSLLLSDADLDDMITVVNEENGFLVLIPLTVLIAASLFFAEHDHDTLKNLMCIPVSKGRLVAAKLFVLLLFDISYQLTGYGISILMCALSGVSLKGWGLHLFLVLANGILLFSASMPCILLVVWCNKSYIISVIIAFAYTMLGYILHISDTFLMVPLGLNAATLLPVPMIFRWLYQFHSMQDAGEIRIEFYNRFSPYFVPTPVVFAVLIAEAALCAALMIRIYRKQNI